MELTAVAVAADDDSDDGSPLNISCVSGARDHRIRDTQVGRGREGGRIGSVRLGSSVYDLIIVSGCLSVGRSAGLTAGLSGLKRSLKEYSLRWP